MIKIKNDLKRELIKVAIISPKRSYNIDEKNYMYYVMKMKDVVENIGYEITPSDSNIEVGVDSKKNPYVVISCVGMGDRGQFLTFSMENDGSHFTAIGVFDRDFEEIDTLEI